MKKLVDELNAKFKENLKHSMSEPLINLQVKVLLGSTTYAMYKSEIITVNEWTEAMDYINNLN